MLWGIGPFVEGEKFPPEGSLENVCFLSHLDI